MSEREGRDVDDVEGAELPATRGVGCDDAAQHEDDDRRDRGRQRGELSE
ncbi:hypothetical protein [Microbacterium sp. Se63.02b]|nr:hypothetical protein [Microbacterium sp. Se63.02b]QNA92349.1 hypothetical protein G4G29_08140 [Microbacterium sp. Se63.02b]